MKQSFVLKNLCCAHCAAKIEQAVSELDGVAEASLNFTLQKLTVDSENPNIIESIQNVCNRIEDSVIVSIYKENKKDEYEEIVDELEEEKMPVWLLVVAGIFEIAAIALTFIWKTEEPVKVWVALGLTIASAILSGHKLFIDGIKNIFKLSFEESALMTIAVIPAFFIGEYIEAAMVTLLFAIGELIEDYAVDKSRADIKKLADIRAEEATVLTDPDDETSEKTIDVFDVKVGSVIVVKPFQRVPVDGIVIKGSTLIDTSAVTGESIPQEVEVGSSVCSGAVNGSNQIYIKATATCGDSTASRILRLIEEAAGKKSNGEKLVGRFARVYTPVVIGIAVILAVVPPLLHLGSFSIWLYRALICLVASCPCSIVLSVPLAYFSSIGRASGLGALVKGARYLEILSKTDAFVFDKTGTLTTDEIKISRTVSFDSKYTSSDILNLAAALDKNSTHPIAIALCQKATDINKYILTDYRELSGYGVSATLDGVVCKLGSRRILSDEQKQKYDGYNVYLLINESVVGAVQLTDTVRAEAQDVVNELKKLGIRKQIVLSGASESEVQSVADLLGLTSGHGNLLPEGKLAKFGEIKARSLNAAFVGDGINDGPVLAASDVGIAMGFGSDAAIESADIVLSKGELSPLPALIKLSRKTVSTVMTNIILSIGVKALVIILGAVGLAQMWMSCVADTGLCIVCVAYASRLLRWKDK